MDLEVFMIPNRIEEILQRDPGTSLEGSMAKEVKTLREYKHHEDKRGENRKLCDKRETVELQVLKLGNNK